MGGIDWKPLPWFVGFFIASLINLSTNFWFVVAWVGEVMMLVALYRVLNFQTMKRFFNVEDIKMDL